MDKVKNMEKQHTELYEYWSPLFGKPSQDEEVIRRFHAAGFSKLPYISKDDSEQSEDIGGLTVSFYLPEMIGMDVKLKKGQGVFTGIAIHLNKYKKRTEFSPLPYQFQYDESIEDMIKRLGKPDSAEDEWCSWIIDGFEVTAHFSEDLKIFEDLTVYIPMED